MDYNAVTLGDHRSSVLELFKEAIISAYPDNWIDAKVDQDPSLDSVETTLRERVGGLDAMQLDRIGFKAGGLKNELLLNRLTWE